MCGIVGFTGNKKAAPILIEGLYKLEYRGYDSAGIAVINNNGINIYKARGRLDNLSSMINRGESVEGFVGIGHTRWATHGEPSDVNSHPHMSKSGHFAVVHNGIIENYMRLKEMLESKGYEFMSQTDTEVIANMIDCYFDGDMISTVAKVINRIEGSYALGILSKANPDEIIAVRKDSPLIVGISDEGNYIASDVPAILAYTRKIIYLQDNEIVVMNKDKIKIYNMDIEEIDKEVCDITWDISAAEKGGYEHFMFKEIMEQPQAVRDTLNSYIKHGEVCFDNIKLDKEKFDGIKKIYIVACGSAYHVGVLGKYIIEKYVRIPVETLLASEFRYQNPLVDENTLMIIISQSGETADTLAALREGKSLGAHILSIINVVGSSIANISDDVIYTRAGPEIAVATTKAYSTQLAVIYLLTLYFAKQKGTMTDAELYNYIEILNGLPDKISEILSDYSSIQYLASLYYNNRSIFFMGRNIDYAMAMEGSLKLKEISYIHSEAYAAGELKHGTISLIEGGTPVIALGTVSRLADKTVSNIKEVKARGAEVIALTQEKYAEIVKAADHVIYIPDADEFITPSLSVVPLQILAYYIASFKGYDIDKPRNLAKSVTVE